MYTNLKIYKGTGVGDETMSSKHQAGNVNDQWQTKLMWNRMYNVFLVSQLKMYGIITTGRCKLLTVNGMFKMYGITRAVR